MFAITVATGFFMAMVFAAGSYAASPPFAPGEYETDGGWGSLTLSPAEKDGQAFVIDTIGANAHLCNLEGKLVGGTGKVEDAGCTISFTAKNGGIQITSTGDSCRDYCGARAYFDGVYLKPPVGCENEAVRKTRAAFKQLYDRKQYRQALDKLSPIPSVCAKSLFWMEKAEIANDIGITQYKLGMRDACLKTLAPLAKEAARSDEQIREDYPPTDAESYLPSVKAARTNLHLCRGLKK